jgi:hypothetical protein
MLSFLSFPDLIVKGKIPYAVYLFFLKATCGIIFMEKQKIIDIVQAKYLKYIRYSSFYDQFFGLLMLRS